MSYYVEQIQLVCKAIAKLRAGGCCEMCGKRPVEGHHIFYGSIQHSDWQTWSNSDFYASLCAHHHRGAPEAPHVSNQTFLAVYLPKVESVRRAVIIKRIDCPIKRPETKCPYKKVLADLKRQYDALEKTRWMDDIEPQYGRTECR